MTDWILLQLAQHGVVLLGVGTFLSCLALPIPASLLMLSAGAFVASGDLGFAATVGAALAGAVAGDQLGFLAGRSAGGRIEARLARRAKSRKLAERARDLTGRYGPSGVFLSRWLLSPLGPYANLAAGAGGLGWMIFTLAAVAGEIVWVMAYVGLGASFAANIDMIAELAGDMSGLLAAGTVTLGLGLMLRRAMVERRARR